MALSLTQTDALAKILKPGMRVASMGYPDIIAPLPLIQTMFNKDMPKAEYRTDSAAICKRHGMEEHGIIDAVWLFEVLKCKLDVYDVVRERGCEIICDLNGRLDPALRAFNYDIVLDVGTAEHCFNIAQALINMAGMVKMGGYIIHENPFNCGNHGFYNLNPTLFADFYSANGFKVLECKLVDKHGGQGDVPHVKRFKFTNQECNVFTLSQRVEVKSFVYPVQSKYANLIPVAGASGEKEAA